VQKQPFSNLPKNFYIPTDVISNALNACGFPKQRHKFAINLFRHVCTIGEAHGRKGLFLWESSRDLKSKMKNVHRFGVFI
jgi:hypothetical protein